MLILSIHPCITKTFQKERMLWSVHPYSALTVEHQLTDHKLYTVFIIVIKVTLLESNCSSQPGLRRLSWVESGRRHHCCSMFSFPVLLRGRCSDPSYDLDPSPCTIKALAFRPVQLHLSSLLKTFNNISSQPLQAPQLNNSLRL